MGFVEKRHGRDRARCRFHDLRHTMGGHVFERLTDQARRVLWWARTNPGGGVLVVQIVIQ